MAVINFDANQFEPFEQGSTKFPLGDYPFTITEVVQEASKQNARSGMLVVTIKVTQGAFAGCTQKARFNLWNENEQARTIAARQFSSLCHSIGRLHIADDQQLLGGTGVALIGPQEDNDKYSEVKVWKDNNYRVNGKGDPQKFFEGNTQTATQPAPWGTPAAAVAQANASASQPANDTPPWAAPAQQSQPQQAQPSFGAPSGPPAFSTPATAPPSGPPAGGSGVPPWLQK